ncbi:MAG: hypothetical protein NPIRA02_17800 [Nitrospirales bacterium]|nr:MAG: hypothetical protein NPIRA02_17800 [Nitrospirales bacterium]
MTLTATFFRRTGQIILCIIFLFAVEGVNSASPRTIVFISDLHMGLGKDANGSWYKTEDFRWPVAFEGFLKHISQPGNAAVDLVIVGDFLELWQPPTGVTCKGPNGDYGCSLEEMTVIAGAVLKAHSRELAALAAFSRKGTNRTNCVHVIPGNHDAALVLDNIWAMVADSLESDTSCINRVKDGTWKSEKGRVVAEHGHQIGWDPNRYEEWPTVSKQVNGVTYLERPWGEQFVQKIFNDEEESYPLIDNLSPLSAGTKYRMGDRGVFATVFDFFRFVKFNLLETSVRQKIAFLGETDNNDLPKWDTNKARDLGSALFAGAFAKDDPLAAMLSVSDKTNLEQALRGLAQDRQKLPDNAVLALCDQIAVRKAKPQCPTTTSKKLGSAVEKLLWSRERVVGPYVKGRWEDLPNMRVFVYGHTHAFEKEWPVEISSRVKVSVLNDGAFQRIIDDEKFRAIARSKKLSSLGKGLRMLQLEELPACYTFVSITESPTGGLNQSLQAWYMEEKSVGQVVDVCDSRCPSVGRGC